MANIIHADIFFFVTTIAVVALSIALLIALFYIIRILRTMKEVSDLIKIESQHVAGDVEQLRATIKNSGFSMGSVYHFFKQLMHARTSKFKSKVKKTDLEEDI